MEEICSISRKWDSHVIGNFLTFGNDDYNTPEIFIDKIKNMVDRRLSPPRLWVVAYLRHAVAGGMPSPMRPPMGASCEWSYGE